jgi:dephospho-CoA kinase
MPNGRSNRRVIGLTGGMGSGKSTVLALFKNKGAVVLDADAIVKDLLSNDRKVGREIRKKFGQEVFDDAGKIDRKALAHAVFPRPRRRKALERILHPRVRAAMWSALRNNRKPIAVLDIPLLYESKWQKKLDGVIVVNADMKTRLARLKKRGFAPAEARRRIKVQMDLAEKARRADFVINNNRSIKETKQQVDEIWNELPKMTRRKHGIAAGTKNNGK